MSPHILVVEDSPLVIGALRALFEAMGHRFSEASTIADALRLFREDSPDVVLLDLTLPDGSGTEVLEFLRGRDGAPITAVLTGHDDRVLAERCLALGCREVLLKPVPPRELLRKVEGWCGVGGRGGA
ncbi:MAG TPA: response regulator [Gemmatimonadaceae bacterium]|nr:response regulator [Gemmatimonadaceae bacterium]